MSLELDIPGLEQGRREVTVEWGNVTDKRDYPDEAGIRLAPGESSARARAQDTYYGHRGPYRTPVVRRTVVTYTSEWEPVPASPNSEESDRG